MNLNPTKIILGILTPLIAAASGWLAAAAAKYGIHLDASGINALGVAGATAGAAAMVKLIHDVETNIEKDPKDDALLAELEAKVEALASKIVAIDPAAKSQVAEAISAVEAKAEAWYEDLLARIPQPPAEAPVRATPLVVPPSS